MQTGYLRDTQDSQDWLYGALRIERTDLPVRVNYESIIGPALDQGASYQCVAYAVAGLKRFHEWRQSKKWLDFDPGILFAECKKIDGYPNSNGTMPRAAMDIIRTVGMTASDGQFYKIQSYARQNTVQGIKQALIEQGPVVLGLRISIAEFNALSNCEITGSHAEHMAGHCMLAVGYDDKLSAFRIRNSWGDSWGDCGHLWLGYDYLTAVDPNFDAWSTIDETGPFSPVVAA